MVRGLDRGKGKERQQGDKTSLMVAYNKKTHRATSVDIFLKGYIDFPGGSVVKETAYNAGATGHPGFDPWVRKIPWRRARQSIPVFLPGESHGERNLLGYSPQECRQLDTTEHACMHTCVCIYVYMSVFYVFKNRDRTSFTLSR